MIWTNPVTGINLTSILITNLIGILLMLIVLLSKGWMVRVNSVESKIILSMMITVIIGCIVEPLTFILDGIPGNLNHTLSFIANSVLYSLNVVIGPCYVLLLSSHINKKLSKVQLYIVLLLCIFETLILFINIFVPIIFIIDSNNIYVRKSFFWVYVVMEAGMMFYGLVIFFIARGKGKLLKFFPAWQFFIPIVFGLSIQGLMYGIGVAICSIVLCLQNENIFLDKLTGVYNRYYLDELKRGLKSKSKGTLGAMMLDMKTTRDRIWNCTM